MSTHHNSLNKWTLEELAKFLEVDYDPSELSQSLPLSSSQPSTPLPSSRPSPQSPPLLSPSTPLPPSRPSPQSLPLLSPSSYNSKRKCQRWKEEEHRLFLTGMEILGKGNWQAISKHYVRTKTALQIASHAQKYFIRCKMSEKNTNEITENKSLKKKKRSSINDITTQSTDHIQPPHPPSHSSPPFDEHLPIFYGDFFYGLDWGQNQNINDLFP